MISKLIDYSLLGTLFLLPIVLIRLYKSLLVATLLPLISIFSVGILVQSSDYFGLNWNATAIKSFLILAAICCFFTIDRTQSKSNNKGFRPQILSLGVPSLVIFIGIILGRVLAHNQTPHILTNIAFYGGEDNAKWFNVTSLIAQQKALSIGDIGGVGVTFLVVCSAIVRTVFPVIGLGSGPIDVAICTTAVAQLFLVALSPLALISFTKLLGNEQYSYRVTPPLWTSAFLISAGSANFVSLGHLSAQIVLPIIVLSVGFLMMDSNDSRVADLYLCLGLFCLTAAASVWLPMQLMTLLIPISILALRAKRLFKQESSKINLDVFLLQLIVFAAIPIGIQTFTYVSSPGNVRNLLSAGGGTNVMSSIQGILPIVLIVLYLLGKPEDSNEMISGRTLRSNYSNLWIVAVIAFFSVSVIFLSYIRLGDAYYGSQKVQYIFSLVLVITLIPVSISSLPPSGRIVRDTIATFTVSVMVLFALNGDPIFKSLGQRVRSEQWPTMLGTELTSWQAYVTSMQIEGKKIEDLPIACGELIPGKRMLSLNSYTYLCTRELVALAGLEKQAGPLVEWQLRADWMKSLSYMREMPGYVTNRNVLILSAEGIVVGVNPVSFYLENRDFSR